MSRRGSVGNIRQHNCHPALFQSTSHRYSCLQGRHLSFLQCNQTLGDRGGRPGSAQVDNSRFEATQRRAYEHSQSCQHTHVLLPFFGEFIHEMQNTHHALANES